MPRPRKPTTQHPTPASLRLRADYDAVVDKKKRTPPRSVILSEDDHLGQSKRRKMLATAHDQLRNFALAGWMIRKHTSYVSRFNFHVDSDDKGFERALEQFIAVRSRAQHFDVSGRMDRQAALTMTERLAVLDGDCFWLKLLSRQVQMIESDLVWTANDMPASYTARNWVHGIEVNEQLRPLNYMLCKREGYQRRFQAVARAWNVLPRAYRWTTNQVRGITPLAPIINTNQDVYENFDYALHKMKLHSLFGVAILKRTPEVGRIGGIPISGTQTAQAATDSEEDDESSTADQVKKNFIQPGVASIIELLTDEDIKLLESSTPSTEFKDFSELMIHMALCALDIPMIFFDPKTGSFSIHRTAKLEYERSCKEKQDENITLLDSWTLWQVYAGLESGELTLPRGWTIEDAKWEWVPQSTPWFDELDEIDAASTGLAAGILDPLRWIKERTGQDPYVVLDNIAKFKNYAAAQGLQLVWGRSPITLTATPASKRPEGSDEN